MKTILFAALLLTGNVAVLAQDPTAYPRIREIVFAGNDTTQADVLLREMVVHVGDPADPARMERSRQAIQDLRLFRSVDLEEKAMGDGVQLRVTVREKYYILPLPRASANSDGQYSYGVGMRWWNVLGLNHTLHVTVEQGTRQEVDRGTFMQYQASYDVPFLFQSPYGMGLSFAHTAEPVTGVLPYDNISDSARWTLSRALGDGPASQGWRIGAGVQWLNQDRSGVDAPAPDGQSTALVLNTNFNDMRFNIYSEDGRKFSLEAQSTIGNLASDYGYSELIGAYDQSWLIGDTPHQSVGVFAEGGVYDGGPKGAQPAFSLGGSGNLRGYELRFQRGNNYYYGGVEALRPLYWNWLRGVAFVEAGNVFGSDSNSDSENIYADVGIGLRMRLNWFVRTELNLGIAFPLVDGGESQSSRIFATGHR